MADPIKVASGKKAKAQGSQFELRVRADLEDKGWIVDKWTNNVEFGMQVKFNGDIKKDFTPKLVRAKAKWAGPGRPMMMGAGFPDFSCHRISVKLDSKGTRIVAPCIPSCNDDTFDYQIIGVESKLTGDLDREEKEKCKWLLDNNIFSKILIAKKTKVKNRVVIVYEDFKEKYWRFYK